MERAIGQNVAQLVRDGDTLQLGIGAIPDAVLLFLKEKNDLGIHTEMFSDGVVELAEAGNITNQKKTLHRGQSVATFLMGTRRLYDYVDNNPAVAMYPVQYVNDPYVIAQNDNLVSINSCVQIDLMGQVVSTSVGLRQISGVGGQIDFVRGANMSKEMCIRDRGGILPARIRPKLSPQQLFPGGHQPGRRCGRAGRLHPRLLLRNSRPSPGPPPPQRGPHPGLASG